MGQMYLKGAMDRDNCTWKRYKIMGGLITVSTEENEIK